MGENTVPDTSKLGTEDYPAISELFEFYLEKKYGVDLDDDEFIMAESVVVVDGGTRLELNNSQDIPLVNVDEYEIKKGQWAEQVASSKDGEHPDNFDSE